MVSLVSMIYKEVDGEWWNTLDGAGFDSQSLSELFAIFWTVFLNYLQNCLKLKKGDHPKIWTKRNSERTRFLWNNSSGWNHTLCSHKKRINYIKSHYDKTNTFLISHTIYNIFLKWHSLKMHKEINKFRFLFRVRKIADSMS